MNVYGEHYDRAQQIVASAYTVTMFEKQYCNWVRARARAILASHNCSGVCCPTCERQLGYLGYAEGFLRAIAERYR